MIIRLRESDDDDLDSENMIIRLRESDDDDLDSENMMMMILAQRI